MTLDTTLTALNHVGQSLPAVKITGTNQAIAVGAASVQSAAFGTGVSLIRVATTVDCYIAQGSNPTASSSTPLLTAGSIEHFVVAAGEKLAAIRVSTSGVMSITEVL